MIEGLGNTRPGFRPHLDIIILVGVQILYHHFEHRGILLNKNFSSISLLTMIRSTQKASVGDSKPLTNLESRLASVFEEIGLRTNYDFVRMIQVISTNYQKV
jgi:hypothetical protein